MAFIHHIHLHKHIYACRSTCQQRVLFADGETRYVQMFAVPSPSSFAASFVARASTRFQLDFNLQLKLIRHISWILHLNVYSIFIVCFPNAFECIE